MNDLQNKPRTFRKYTCRLTRLFLNKWRAGLTLLCLLGCVAPAPAMTLNELRVDTHLTPATLLRRFAPFQFKLSAQVQSPASFLRSQTGDCDDFATLAADVLREKGYATHLIAVFMEKQVHVVCYVTEANAYLDYNNRRQPSPLVPTNGSLADIAGKVAQSFHASWRCASEYTRQNGRQQTIRADFH